MPGGSATARSLLLVLAVTLLIRLPFLNQAIQGDDVYYLAGAQHAQIDPLHPNHARYAFLGEIVDMRGHPHPPFNAWFLAGLLALFGDIYEVRFHAAYILFSLVAALAMWSLARRFSPRPLLATLLFLATPAFVVNGNSFESDLPFLALWMASIASFILAVNRRSRRWLVASVVAMTLAALSAYQSALIVPILALYLWWKRRDWRPAWAAVLTVPVVLAAWQLWERASTGEMPVAVLGGYFQTYGLQALLPKLRNAAALTTHSVWIVFPILVLIACRRAGRIAWLAAIVAAAGGMFLDPNPLFCVSFGTGVLLLGWCIGRLRGPDVEGRFLAAWILLFFTGALVLFFAGSARYLLPMAAPVALLMSRAMSERPRLLAAAFVLQLILGLSLSVVNFQHWNGYRNFARDFRHESETRRVWINGEWGLRYYFEADGGLPLLRSQAVGPDDIVVSSELAFPIPFTTGGGVLVPLAERPVESFIPLRLLGLGARSGYSTASLGLRPFDVTTGPIDRLHAQVVAARKPVLVDLPMNAPEAAQQIVSGIYELEAGTWRWMSGRAVLLLHAPTALLPLRVTLHIPDNSPARRVTVAVDGAPAIDRTFSSPGSYTVSSEPLRITSESPTVTITVDKTFSPAGDHRSLGIILNSVGFAR